MTDPLTRVAFVAGEASGDLLAAPLVAKLRAHEPSYASVGVAGERMIAAGCEAWIHVRDLSVRGYVEVLRELPRILRIRRDLVRRLQTGSCAALVGVDSPDFNLSLEARVRARGVPTVHYVSPSIWAWRAGRIEDIRRAADRVLLVFPFEQAIYDRAGIPANYVGHPLASSIPLYPDRDAACARLAIATTTRWICLMPGSRRAEIDYIAPVFFDAAARLARLLPGVRFVLPVADPSLRPVLEAMRERLRGRAGAQGGAANADSIAEAIMLVDGRSHDCLEACDGALIASGTATLEAALFKRPMVIAYRMPALSAWIMRRIGGYLPWVGLPNILANEWLVPELLQEQATGEGVANALLKVLDDNAAQKILAERFLEMHESLRRDTPSLASEAILHTVASGRSALHAHPARVGA